VYLVERVRDGRSFTTRRVTVVQHGKTIFTLSASFQEPEAGGFEHFMPMPQVPRPDELEPTRVRLQRLFGPAAGEFSRDSPIEMRHVGPLSVEVERDPSLAADSNIVWLRADGELPDDPLLHVCLMTYASDMTLLDTVLHAHRVSWSDRTIVGASLDHAMWFHRQFRADEWLLYAQDSPSATGGRGLARGEVYTADGQLVVSVVQEGLLRRRAR
jgi:acyl-CoA thioesterase-2